MHFNKSHGIIMNYKERLLAMAPSSYEILFIISICLRDRNLFARFDEIPGINDSLRI